MTRRDALQVAIDQLESDAEATESEEDAAYWIEAATVLRSMLPAAVRSPRILGRRRSDEHVRQIRLRRLGHTRSTLLRLRGAAAAPLFVPAAVSSASSLTSRASSAPWTGATGSRPSTRTSMTRRCCGSSARSSAARPTRSPYPPPCSSRDGKPENWHRHDHEIGPEEVEEWKHSPHSFEPQWGSCTVQVRVCACGYFNEEVII